MLSYVVLSVFVSLFFCHSSFFHLHSSSISFLVPLFKLRSPFTQNPKLPIHGFSIKVNDQFEGCSRYLTFGPIRTTHANKCITKVIGAQNYGSIQNENVFGATPEPHHNEHLSNIPHLTRRQSEPLFSQNTTSKLKNIYEATVHSPYFRTLSPHIIRQTPIIDTDNYPLIDSPSTGIASITLIPAFTHQIQISQLIIINHKS